MSEQTPPPTPTNDMDDTPRIEEEDVSIVSPEMADMIGRVATLEEENAQLKNAVLYAKAEVENVRRRMEQQLEERGKYAMSGFAKEMLSVADNLGRAMENVPAEKRSEDPFLDNLATGVEMTAREVESIFARNGIEQVPAMNERFDPNLHQAVMEVDNPGVPSGTITIVMQTGYTLNGRLLRPAMVGVAKGGPKADPATAQDNGTNDGEAPV